MDPFFQLDKAHGRREVAASELQLCKFERLAQEILKTQQPEFTRGYGYEVGDIILLFGVQFNPEEGTDGFVAFVEVKDGSAGTDQLRIGYGLSGDLIAFDIPEDNLTEVIGMIECVRNSDKLDDDEFTITGYIQDILNFVANVDVNSTDTPHLNTTEKPNIVDAISQLVTEKSTGPTRTYRFIRELDEKISIVLAGMHQTTDELGEHQVKDVWTTQFTCCDEESRTAYVYRKNSVGQTFLEVLPLDEFECERVFQLDIEDLDQDLIRAQLGLDVPSSRDILVLENVLFRVRQELRELSRD